MLDQALALFEITPDVELSVMRPDQSLGALTARLIESTDRMLAERRPDYVLVQGDTTSTFVGALAAFYQKIPVGHVEAGLRTGDLAAPWPEEGNRRLVTPLASLHFAPTETSRRNLLAEGLPDDRVLVTGNPVIDALHFELARQEERGAEVRAELESLVGTEFLARPYVLITGHRRESFGHGFGEICAALGELARRFPDHGFVYPVHLNPNVKGPVHEQLGEVSNVRLLPPQGYRPFVALMRGATVVLTDSGGVQEEAPGLGKPVLVMRTTTERPEGVEAGTVRLVGADRGRIVDGVSELLLDEGARRKMAAAVNPYGDGHAAERIVAGVRADLERLASRA
jgi:UDP-N-acetylglucosamine 2-epimerase (non-hydrolysing)